MLNKIKEIWKIIYTILIGIMTFIVGMCLLFVIARIGIIVYCACALIIFYLIGQSIIEMHKEIKEDSLNRGE